jgi:hypothetical protein
MHKVYVAYAKKTPDDGGGRSNCRLDSPVQFAGCGNCPA